MAAEMKKIKTEAEAPKVKKPRKPRETVRPVETLMTLPENKLTGKEMVKLIKALKEELNVASQQRDAYKANANAAFEKCQNIEKAYEDMEGFYRKTLRYIDSQVNSFHEAINQATKGGM